jgi:hypothetical protein
MASTWRVLDRTKLPPLFFRQVDRRSADRPLAAMRLSALALAAAALIATPAAAQTIGGRYSVEGTNPNGSPYRGTATIVPRSDTTCRISWQTGPTANGICMMTGKSLVASYAMSGGVGLMLYELQPDGSLKGVWTVADQPGGGTEILTPVQAQ